MHTTSASPNFTLPQLPPPPQRRPTPEPVRSNRRTAAGVVVGLFMTLIGLAGVPSCIMFAILFSNPCGFMGDHCSQYGQASDSFTTFMGLAFVSGLVFVGGLVTLIVAAATRRR